MSCLYILKIKPLLVTSFANIFSQSIGCLFIVFMVSFAVQNLVNLIRSYLFIFLIKKIIVAIPGLCCCDGFSLVVMSRDYSLFVVCGLLIEMASLVAEYGVLHVWAQWFQLLGSRAQQVGSSGTRNGSCVSCTGRWILYH